MSIKNIEKKLEKLEKTEEQHINPLIIYDPQDPKKGADKVPDGYTGPLFFLPDNGRGRND